MPKPCYNPCMESEPAIALSLHGMPGRILTAMLLDQNDPPIQESTVDPMVGSCYVRNMESEPAIALSLHGMPGRILGEISRYRNVLSR